MTSEKPVKKPKETVSIPTNPAAREHDLFFYLLLAFWGIQHLNEDEADLSKDDFQNKYAMFFEVFGLDAQEMGELAQGVVRGDLTPKRAAGRIDYSRIDMSASEEKSNARLQALGGCFNDPYYRRLAWIESRGNEFAANSLSSAKGFFQFIDSTGRSNGITAPFGTAEYTQQEMAAIERFTEDNKRVLTKALGRDPTPGELYLAHQQGNAGALALLSRPDDTALRVLTEVYDGNAGRAKKAILNNGGHLDMTAREFSDLWVQKFEAGRDFTVREPEPAVANAPPPVGAQFKIAGRGRSSDSLSVTDNGASWVSAASQYAQDTLAGWGHGIAGYFGGAVHTKTPEEEPTVQVASTPKPFVLQTWDAQV